MRHVLALIAGLVTGAVAFAVLVYLMFVLGGTECDRGECNWFGEAIDENGAVAAIVVYGLVVAAGVMAARAVLRRR